MRKMTIAKQMTANGGYWYCALCGHPESGNSNWSWIWHLIRFHR